MSHVLVVANETVDAPTLREALAAHGDDLHVTVVSPVNEPKRGYVVYTDTRRASARRRLERALGHLREAGIPADGYVVDADPAAAVRDALATLEPPVDEILVSTHTEEKSAGCAAVSSTGSALPQGTCRSSISSRGRAAPTRRTCS